MLFKFNYLSVNKKIKFIALGGINEKNRNKLIVLDIGVFAVMSYFQKKTAPQGGRLNNLIGT